MVFVLFVFRFDGLNLDVEEVMIVVFGVVV